MSEKVIDPNGIPQFTGDLEQLERDVSDLRREASQFRDAGGDVHSEFQGLTAFYEAPEAEQLFASTKPVQTKTDAFADDLEKVAQALSDYAGDVRPLVEKLKQLQIEASAFYIDEVSTDDDWRKDDDKVKHNNRLIDEVKAATQAFRKAERDCHNKITALVDGIKLEPSDNGEQSCGTYGFTDEVLDSAEELPWGAKAERDYDGIEWFTHQAKEVGKGFFVDGVIGTGKALKTLVGGDGWGAAGEAWTNLAKLSVGVTLSMGPAASVFWMAKDEQLPGWLRDSRRAVVETGKGLIAYDQWSKNPARAGGLVGFNALSIAATRGAGSAAKAGAAAKAISAVSKVGRAVDPFTYAAKGVTFTVSKVGDLLAPLRHARTGGPLGVADGSYRLVDEGANARPRPAAVPDDARAYADSKGNTLYMTREGAIVDEHGRVLGDMKKEGAGQREPSGAERAAASKSEIPPALRAQERPAVLAGVHANDAVTGEVGRVGDHLPGNSAAHGVSGETGPHTPGGGVHDSHAPTADHTSPGQGAGAGSTAQTHAGHTSSDGSDAASGTSHGSGGAPPTAGTVSGGSASPQGIPSGEHSLLDPQAVDDRIKELDDRQGGEGHAPGRHLRPSDQALKDRLGTVQTDAQGVPKVYGPNSSAPGLLKSENNVDPLTGTTVDGVTGRPHRVGPYATRFDDAEDMVIADAYFRSQIEQGVPPGETPIAEILGPKGHERFTGFYRNPANPSEFLPVDFAGGTIKPVYRFHDGRWNLHTMYANPAPGRHP
ncbi:hypothetical protein GCM10018785_38720 [Streptomyces longispororuber]|uniref:Uncharacterized protein n=1 Tax=Streptomyces longispororuber TaxID=68230 RepID=A0A919DPY6_9ACTN|nr:hypothetical protein [Streptomyces longispororuber]GHE66198.1 hypothetical protein GCM10018785_38720 [Streptomyces longispororuber]